MEFKADLGKLKNGYNAVVIEKGGHLEYVLASGFDPNAEIGKMWSSGKYYYDITSFAKAITEIQTIKLTVENIKADGNLTKDEFRQLDGLSYEIPDSVFLKNGDTPMDILETVKEYVEREIKADFGIDIEITSFDSNFKEVFQELYKKDVTEDYIEVTDIEWDYDDYYSCLLDTAYVPKNELEEGYDVADWLSDNMGYCILSCHYDTEIEAEVER